MRVSIIIATYGDHSWKTLAMERAYPSALNQGAHEIIVGHDDNATIAQIRNTLAGKATGGWLCHLDADDTLGGGYLDAMKKAKDAVYITRPTLFTPAVSYVRKGRPAPPKFNDRGIPLSDDNWLVVGTLITKELFQAIGGFSDLPHGFEDWSCWAKAWKAGAQIVKVPQAVYYAHVNPQSKHRQGWRNRKWQVETHNRVRAELFPE